MIDNRSYIAPIVLVLLNCFCPGGNVLAQQEVGSIEKFALAENRGEVLSELIPETAEYFYFHCLHYQNQMQLGLAQETLEAWRAKLGETSEYQAMYARQMLLSYGENPTRTVDYLRTRFGIQHNHAPPSRDRAAELPTVLDNSELTTSTLLDKIIARDRSLGQIETRALSSLLDRELNPNQLRALLSRLDRADHEKVVDRIAEELSLKDAKGFGWASVHRLLTLKQLEQLLQRKPDLTGDSNFVQAYALRLLPPEGSSLADPTTKRAYLERLSDWAMRLPASKNSFKVLVLGNRLRLELLENRMDRALFVDYLKLPRSAPYYRRDQLRLHRDALADLNFTLPSPAVLPPLRNDEPLVRRYLETFLKDDADVDAFSQWVDVEYLQRVQAEAKILNGIGDKRTWYAKLDPNTQKEIRERVEIGFAPHNPHSWATDEVVKLQVEIKNVDNLTLRIYEIDTLAFYRNQAAEIGTDIDLDGLVPNWQRDFSYTQAPEIRHTESIALPELDGRGVWVVDMLGAGRRSRALIRKGELLAVERPSDAGHVLRVVDEQGDLLEDAFVDLSGRRFDANDKGEILIPFAQKTKVRDVVLGSSDFASLYRLTHLSERYDFHAAFLIDRQALVAGRQAKVAVRSQLTCNGRPVSVELLENVGLSIVATDADGIQTSQHVSDLDLSNLAEWTHEFFVPQRLRQIQFELTGEIYNQSRDEKQRVSTSQELRCNEISDTVQIGDFYLQHLADGFRLRALGRNGEPLAKLPVTVRSKHRDFTPQTQHTLATDESGIIQLGPLQDFESIQVSAQGIRQVDFDLDRVHRAWPGEVNTLAGNEIRLPLGNAGSSSSSFALYEVRGGVRVRDVSQSISIDTGALTVKDLEPGSYELRDYEKEQVVAIRVAREQSAEGTFMDADRIMQASTRSEISIRNVNIADGNLTIEVDSADNATRVHVFAHAFRPGRHLARAAHLHTPDPLSRSRRTLSSHYVDALKLDEEYGYILRRQGLEHYSGNMLPQPSLLVRPWELAETENLSREARAGDALPESAEAPMPMADAEQSDRGKASASSPSWKCFDFLADGEELLANVGLEKGAATIPLGDLSGFSSLTILVIHPTAQDSRIVPLQSLDLKTRDLRLRTAFDAGLKLSQTQKVETLEAGVKTSLGDPRTRRWQLFDSLADVFQFYGTLLQDGRWEDFRFVTNWPGLTAEEKEQHYSEHACHELNFFLYHKDPDFFARVVQPAVSQKMDPQLVDSWLLKKELSDFQPLWRQRRLNAFERILLSSRVDGLQDGTKRWIGEYVEANPIDAAARKQRFEMALRGSALESDSAAGSTLFESLAIESEPAAPARGRGSMMGGGMYGGQAFKKSELSRGGRSRRAGNAKNFPGAEGMMTDDLFGAIPPSDRLGRGQLGLQERGFFQTLDKTKEWAESHYYELRLRDQLPSHIEPNPFWLEYVNRAEGPFLPANLDLPTSNLTEALCALAVIDLPFETPSPAVEIDGEELFVTSDAAAIVFLESIEECTETAEQNSILLGGDIYLSQSDGGREPKPVSIDALLKGTAYRASVVVSNPTSVPAQLSVLSQLPSGAIPLSASKATESFPVQVAPYSTAQVEYQFYFPTDGNFEHYGAQLTDDTVHLTSTESNSLRVLAEPETVDNTTWQYVANWGSNGQVIDFLRKANLQEVDLSLMVFRLGEKAFYDEVTALLEENQVYDDAVWAYAFRHEDETGMRLWLQSREDLLGQVGPVLSSPLCRVVPVEQFSYEHLDYKPLVVSRSHQLGTTRTIENPSLLEHYREFLDVLAHQSTPDDERKLQLGYYLTLQNRIGEAIEVLQSISREEVGAKLQLDYLDAYLCFYQGDYDRAAKLAADYQDYPVRHWDTMFASIRTQIEQRDRLLSGQDLAASQPRDASGLDEGQRILMNRRSERQDELARSTPKLNLQADGRRISLEFANVTTVTLNYYLMDIELLFSRKPFVSQDSNQTPWIRPNLSIALDVSASGGKQDIELPSELANKNVFVEARGAGITRGITITANALQVEMAEQYGQLQVFSEQGRAPVEGAYVKVYARHRDGQVRFYKDGYTDLRGQFDYATLSTSDLDSTKELAILVMDSKLGAVTMEANPPTR